MKTNTIKIFGILAAVLMVTVAFTPLSTFATQLSKDESLGSTPSGNDYSGSSSDADSTPSKSPCSACSPEKPDDEEQEELDRGEESTGSEIADNERQNEDGTDQIPVEQKAIDFPKPPRIMNPYILGGSSDSEKHIIALRLLLSKGLPPSDRFIDKLGDLYDIVDDGDNGVAFGGGGRGGGGLDDNEAGEKVDPDDFHNLHNPDLVGYSFNVTQDSLHDGDNFDVEFWIKNIGDEAAPGDFEVAFYLSDDVIINVTADFFLDNFTVPDEVLPEEIVGPYMYSLVLPGYENDIWEENGDYYVGMWVDSDREITELNEQNNKNRGEPYDLDTVYVTIEKPELSGLSFNVVEDLIDMDITQFFNVSFEIQNTGDVSGDSSLVFNVSCYLSYDDKIDAYADYNFVDHPLLFDIPAGGSTGEIILEFQLPSEWDGWVCDGWYYVGMIIDSSDDINEYDEENNSNMGFGLDYEGLHIVNISGDSRIVDLDVDSDNNNDVQFPDRSGHEDAIEDEEDTPGKYVKSNDDDDNHNGIPDYVETDPIPEEQGELVPLLLEIWNSSARQPVWYRFWNINGSKFCLWKSKYRENKINNLEWYASETWILGDMNGDGDLTDDGYPPTETDTFLFNLALEHPEIFEQLWEEYGSDNYTFQEVCDINQDGDFNIDDWYLFNISVDYQIIRHVPIRFWIEGKLYYNAGGNIKVDVNLTHTGYGVDKTDEIRITVGCNCPTYEFGVPPGYDCEDPNFRSRGWFWNWGLREPYDGFFHTLFGIDKPSSFPLQLWMPSGFGPVDFPPRKVDALLGSAPLVSKETQYFQRPSPIIERPTQSDVIDLITGQPLLQEIDFELPFGGAVFRHTRTYSENVLDHVKEWPNNGNTRPTSSQCTFWDWNGKFWMMSENPIFLIDVTYPMLTTQEEMANDIKRCYFIPDAHHAIPFTFLNDSVGSYVAPPWVDANLQHNGTWNESKGKWDVRPTEFYVWLNKNTIKYTIKAIYEDLWARSAEADDGNIVSVHDPPIYDEDGCNIGGFGVPYYGLVTSITDRYGNRLEYEYCEQRQYNADDPETEECIECHQNTNEKGQLKSLKLITANDEVVWTLLYIYRGFAGHEDDDWSIDDGIQKPNPPDYEIYRLHKLHAIYVYEGDRSTSQYDSMTIGFLGNFSGLESFDEYDAIDEVEIFHLPDDWVMNVRYLYEEVSYNWYCKAEDGTQYREFWNNGCEESINGYNLLKTTVTKRTQNSTEVDILDTTHTIYRYDQAGQGYGVNDGLGMKMVFYNPTIEKIVEERNQTLGIPVNENILFTLKDTDELDFDDPDTPEDEDRTVRETADLYMLKKYSSGGEFCDMRFDLLNDFIEGSNTNTILFTDNKMGSGLIDRRPDGENGVFNFYLYKRYPEDFFNPGPGCVEGYQNDYRCEIASEYHHPYRYDSNPLNDPDEEFVLKYLPRGQPFHIMVIDEHEDETDFYDDTNYPNEYSIISRRVVKMNPAGFILEDRTWTVNETGEFELTAHSGYTEHYEYNERGSLIKKKTRGWASPENQLHNDPNISGLVYNYTHYYNSNYGVYYNNIFYEYPKKNMSRLCTVGIQSGDASEGQDVYVQKLCDYNMYQPELVNRTIKFSIPVLLSELILEDGTINETMVEEFGAVTETQYEFNTSDSDDSPWEWPIIQKTVIGPAVKQTRDGPAYHTFEKSLFDENGNLVWFGYGTLPRKTLNLSCEGLEGGVFPPGDLFNLPNHVEFDPPEDTDMFGLGPQFFVNYGEYDKYGRLNKSVVDADPEYYDFPRGFIRLSSTPPLNETTSYEYDTTYGLRKIVYPNGREQHFVYVDDHEGDGLYMWTYNDVVWNSDRTHWQVLSPIQIRYLKNFNVVWIKEAWLDETDEVDEAPDGDEWDRLNVISTSTPEYDPNGRIIGAKKEGEGDNVSVSAQKISYYANGEPERTVDPDGTTTRYTYTMRGYLERIYRGTNDIHPYWGTACPPDRYCKYCNDPNDYPGNEIFCRYPDNTVLIEKRYYGNRTNDAGELVAIRKYRNKSNNQYFDSAGPTNNEDEIGWTENISYDWRMRKVLVTHKSETGRNISHTLTYYDHLNRVVLEVVYGETLGVPADVDPRELKPGWKLSRDNITAILRAQAKPLSLTETIYNNRNLVEEVRTYDVLSGAYANYTATLTFYDYKDNPVETHSPNSPIQQYIYDAKNRMVLSRSVAAGYEITQTETTYDANDRAIKTVSWERQHDAGQGKLNNENSTKTYIYNWHDDAGKVIATAFYGTNSTDNTFSNGDEPDYDASDPPYPGSDDVQVTRFDYDGAGRQNATFHQDDTATRYEYDDLGRQILVTENADDPDQNLRRHTAYYYDNRTGQLQKMAAVLPNHNDSNVNNWSDINWAADDGTLQVTQMIYGADVVDSEQKALTFDGNNDYVMIPDSDGLRFDGSGSGFTIAVWFKADDTSSSDGRSITDMGDDGSGWRLFLQDDYLTFIAHTGQGQVSLRHPFTDTTAWHHAAVTYRTEGNGAWIAAKLFLDGDLVAETDDIGSIGYNNENFTFGGMAADPCNRSFIGQIEKVIIYDECLCLMNHHGTCHIRLLYLGGSPPCDPVGSWEMNGGSEDTVIDSEGGHDGSVHGATWFGRVMSSHGGWIAAVRYPDNVTGQPSMDDVLRFKYYFDGSIAYRTDAKGIITYYDYDELGRLNETLVDDSYYYDPYQSGEPWYAPEQRIHRITYEHEPDGLPFSVTAYNTTMGVISQNNFSYDGMRNLVNESQAHGGLVTGSTPTVWYEWEFSNATSGNFNRPKNITYPLPREDSFRNITFNYDGANGLDSVLSRVSSIEVTGLLQPSPVVSSYEYAGLSRRVAMELGDGVITQDVICGSSSGYAGLDRFGRMKDLQFKNSFDETVHRYQYGYDLAGNRKYANVTQCNPDGSGLVNDRSFLFKYDALNRLVNSSMGQLDGSNQHIILDAAPLTRLTEWKLDNLGNWANGTAQDGSMIRQDYAETGLPSSRYQVHHDVNSANQIMVITEKIDDGQPSAETVVSDRAGNFIFDGEFLYQYDGLNRLMQVNEVGDLSVNDFDGDGRIISSQPGPLIAQYLYDGLGRLIVKETSTTTEHYYYDGVRRIQENIDGTDVREYIYGLDYVDEFVCQITPDNQAVYMLQDANYNVMALLNNDGDVLRQYQYDPYGTIACLDIFPNGESLVNCVGHQGLFFENFNGDGLEEDVDGLYYNRNRWYSPTLGRFLSRDPNEAAMPIFTALSMNGDIMQIMAHAYSLQGQYGDGMNLYQYCGSNPVNNADPSGLRSLTYFIIKMIGCLEGYFDLNILPSGTVWLSDFISTSIKIFKHWRSIGYDKILYSKVINALNIAIQALKTGLTAFINAMINVGRIAGPYVLQALRVMGSTGAAVLSFLASAAIAAAPYMAVIGVFILAGYAGYKLGEWLSPIIDRLGNQLWEFMWGTAQGRAQSIAAPALQAAAAYSTQLDAFMDDIEEDWPGG